MYVNVYQISKWLLKSSSMYVRTRRTQILQRWLFIELICKKYSFKVKLEKTETFA